MRYFFHIETDNELLEDLDGTEAPSAQAAYDDAVAAVQEMLIEALWFGEEPTGTGILILNEHGWQVGKVRYADHQPVTSRRHGSAPNITLHS